MGFYRDHVVPHLVNLAMRNRDLVPYRQRVVSAARGRVLEIGIGSGINLPFYPPATNEIFGLEPAPRLVEMAQHSAQQSSATVKFVEASAEAIPLDNNSIDTVVMTWTLCSIPDARQALAEMRRVLRAGGQLLFVEHGQAPEESVRKWQNRLTPVWKRIAGGCHLNRPIPLLIESSGFRIAQIRTGYMRGPKPMTFMYEGCARPL
jgi:ubiquinone/menaquinone biosynthesis C-methylase UbiE